MNCYYCGSSWCEGDCGVFDDDEDEVEEDGELEEVEFDPDAADDEADRHFSQEK